MDWPIPKAPCSFIISGTFLSWESVWAQPQTSFKAAKEQITVPGATEGEAAGDLSVCLCGGQTPSCPGGCYVLIWPGSGQLSRGAGTLN